MFGYVKIQLADVGKVSMCKRIMKAETSSSGDVPFYKIGTFGKKADAFISREKFDEYRNTYSYPKKGDILISAAGTIGRTVVYNGEDAYYQDSNIEMCIRDRLGCLHLVRKVHMVFKVHLEKIQRLPDTI